MTTTTRTRARVALVGILALGLFLGACSSSSDSSSSSKDGTTTTAKGDSGSTNAKLPDPCSLLTADDYTTITGVTFGEGTFNAKLSQKDGQQICDWKATGDTFATGQVLVLSGGKAIFDSNKSSAKGALGDTTDVTVAGADEAYATGSGSIVATRVGDLYLQVSYIPSGPGDVTDKTVALAEKAVGNI